MRKKNSKKFKNVKKKIKKNSKKYKISPKKFFKPLTVVNQFYDAEITKEYVMRGNAAILKCLIPSFVSDFVQVVAWVDEDGREYISESDFNGGKFGFI
jgi:hypothetical protein